ncbi:hypothetical protein K3495_g16977, partial [Podosphaera aphanis]
MSKIQSFPDKFDVEEKGIDNAWETLKTYRRRLTSADETLKNTYPDKALFHILTKALPKKYTSILDGFRTNPRTTVEERLQILLEKEEDSRDYEKAHPALEKGRYQRQRRSSDITMIDAPDTFNEIICYKCDGKNHISRFCPYADAIKAYGIALREKDEHRSKKKRTTKLKSKKPPKPETNDKTLMRLKTKTKKRHGYTAYEDIS